MEGYRLVKHIKCIQDSKGQFKDHMVYYWEPLVQYSLGFHKESFTRLVLQFQALQQAQNRWFWQFKLRELLKCFQAWDLCALLPNFACAIPQYQFAQKSDKPKFPPIIIFWSCPTLWVSTTPSRRSAPSANRCSDHLQNNDAMWLLDSIHFHSRLARINYSTRCEFQFHF